MNVLVFPCDMPEAIRSAYESISLGHKCFGASIDGISIKPYEKVFKLPKITSDNFGADLIYLLGWENIKGIICEHPVILQFLKTFKFDKIKIHASNSHLTTQGMTEYWKSQSDNMWINGIIRQACHQYGESSPEKLKALIRNGMLVPKGDFVEIGTLAGRSAIVLAALASKYSLGRLLCIDPWSMDVANEQKEQPAYLTEDRHQRDFDLYFDEFEMGVQCFNNVQWLKMKSEDAYQIYKDRNPEHGMKNLEGEIAYLHIDGNHDQDAVLQDINQWTTLVKRGGLICIDDVEWWANPKAGEAVKSQFSEYFIEAGSLWSFKTDTKS